MNSVNSPASEILTRTGDCSPPQKSPNDCDGKASPKTV